MPETVPARRARLRPKRTDQGYGAVPAISGEIPAVGGQIPVVVPPRCQEVVSRNGAKKMSHLT
jgi:hypothetical protein